MNKDDIKAYICMFILGLGIGFMIRPIAIVAENVDTDSKYVEDIGCKLMSDSSLHDEFSHKRVTGSIVRAAVDLYSDLCIVIVNKELSSNNYAIVNNFSLWTEDELQKDDYGYYINKELFNKRLRYDESRLYYIVSDFILRTRCNSKLTAADSDSYVSSVSIYESYIIKTEAGEVIGVVFFEI